MLSVDFRNVEIKQTHLPPKRMGLPIVIPCCDSSHRGNATTKHPPKNRPKTCQCPFWSVPPLPPGPALPLPRPRLVRQLPPAAGWLGRLNGWRSWRRRPKALEELEELEELKRSPSCMVLTKDCYSVILDAYIYPGSQTTILRIDVHRATVF